MIQLHGSRRGIRLRLKIISYSIILLYFSLAYSLFRINLDDNLSKNKYDNKSIEQRASIVDCNNIILATNVKTLSLYAHPRQIVNAEQVIEQLHKIFPYVSKAVLSKKLKSTKYFVWIKKHTSSKEYEAVQKLGIIGLNFTSDQRRFYPHSKILSHTLGYVDMDNHGVAGIERYYDSLLKSSGNVPLKLGIDIRVQQILYDQITNALKTHSAKGAMGIVMNAKNGVIKAAVSLPDFDPNTRSIPLDKRLFNQLSLGAVEMGSIFKALTVAIALDGKCIDVNEAFDVSRPMQFGRWKIGDYKAKGGLLSVPEILKYSSNIGTIHINSRIGIKAQQNYFRLLGMFDKLPLDIAEIATPLFPNKIGKIQSATMSYGHGIAATPFHMAAAFAATVNGGIFHTPHFKLDSEYASRRIFLPSTSKIMRQLLRLVVAEGFGKKADVNGYFVGGKTGTAEKVSNNGKYNKKANFAFFIGAFPIFDPQYIVMIGLDEAEPNALNFGYTTGGMIAAPVGGDVIKEIAPILRIEPMVESSAARKDIENQLYVRYQPRYKKNRHYNIRG